MRIKRKNTLGRRIILLLVVCLLCNENSKTCSLYSGIFHGQHSCWVITKIYNKLNRYWTSCKVYSFRLKTGAIFRRVIRGQFTWVICKWAELWNNLDNVSQQTILAAFFAKIARGYLSARSSVWICLAVWWCNVFYYKWRVCVLGCQKLTAHLLHGKYVFFFVF